MLWNFCWTEWCKLRKNFHSLNFCENWKFRVIKEEYLCTLSWITSFWKWKKCFLQFFVFQRGYSLGVSKILFLYIYTGFVKKVLGAIPVFAIFFSCSMLKNKHCKNKKTLDRLLKLVGISVNCLKEQHKKNSRKN